MKPAAVTAIVAVLVAVPLIFLTRRMLPALLCSASKGSDDVLNRRYDTGDCMSLD